MRAVYVCDTVCVMCISDVGCVYLVCGVMWCVWCVCRHAVVSVCVWCMCLHVRRVCLCVVWLSMYVSMYVSMWYAVCIPVWYKVCASVCVCGVMCVLYLHVGCVCVMCVSAWCVCGRGQPVRAVAKKVRVTLIMKQHDFLLKGWIVSYGPTKVSEQRNVIQSSQSIPLRTMRAAGGRRMGGKGWTLWGHNQIWGGESLNSDIMVGIWLEETLWEQKQNPGQRRERGQLRELGWW